MLSMSSNLHPAVVRSPVVLAQTIEHDAPPPSQQPIYLDPQKLLQIGARLKVARSVDSNADEYNMRREREKNSAQGEVGIQTRKCNETYTELTWCTH
jgi:hypothetical protein